MPPDQLKKYGYCNDGDKPKMEGYNYLLKSKLYTWETIDDNEFYTDTCKSFNSLGFSPEEQEAVWKTLSCTLNLGNVDIDASVSPCSLKDGQFLDKVVSLLAVDKAALIEGCCVKKITIQGQTISSARSAIQCESIRDALAKDLFNNVFNWIVRKLNLN